MTTTTATQSITTAAESDSDLTLADREDILTNAPTGTAGKKAPASIQRMTVTVKVDVLMEEFGEEFGVAGWSPTRAALRAYLQDVLETVDHERLARVVASLQVR